MSGICGVFHRDGRPATTEDIRPMMAEMAVWGPDGATAWHQGPISFGHLSLHNTTGAAQESWPVIGESGNVMVAAARLDNRAELAAILDLSADQSDGSVILAAFQKWGEGCFDRVLGDWSVAIWNPAERRLHLARDHHGNTSLFFFESPALFAFASSLRALVLIPALRPALDEEAMARYLVPFPDEFRPTPYRGVRRLFPAHFLRISPDRLIRERYWFPERVPPLVLGSDAAYKEVFVEVFTEAVSCRARCTGQLGVALSSGLDSASVAAIAARGLHSDARLLGISSVPLYPPEDPMLSMGVRVGDETPGIRAIAEHVGNIDVVLDRAEQITPVEGIRRMGEILAEPYMSATQAYFFISLFEAAQARGVRTLLDGEGGNASISWDGRRLWHELARRRRFSRLLQEIKTQCRERNGGRPYRQLASATVGAYLPRTLAMYRRIRNGSASEDLTQHLLRVAPVRREVLADLGLDAELRDALQLPSGPNADREARLVFLGPGRHTIGFVAHQLAAQFSMDACSPAFDKRVLEFCLAIPTDQFRRGREGRWLIRRSMTGLLPESVVDGRRRGLQAADIVPRLRTSRSEVVEALETLDGSQTARVFLDIGKMWRAFRSLETSLSEDSVLGCRNTLLPGIAAGLFLARFD